MSKSHQPTVSNDVQTGQDTGTDAGQGNSQGGGQGNAARQEQLKKKMGGGKHLVEKGDTLWGLSETTYGRGNLWHRIYDANPGKTQNGGNLIFVGTLLNLPEIELAGPAEKDAGPNGGGQCQAIEPVLHTTEFGTFEVYPDSYEGALPQSHAGIQPVKQATFNEITLQNIAKPFSNPDIDALEDNVCFATQSIAIGTEMVNVSSKAEALHAARIFRKIKEEYGIDVKSTKGVDAVKKNYKDVAVKTELDKLKTKEWEYKEVVALDRALAHFAPILGAKRKKSSRKGVDQEVTSIGKVNNSLNDDNPSNTYMLDSTTMGEYFSDSKNFSMFEAGTDSTTDFSDNQVQLEGTAIHEIAHGLMKNEVAGYATTLAYWLDEDTKDTHAKKPEKPVTKYGENNAREDLCEAVMFYFVDNATLKKKCPIRHGLIKTMVESWTPKKSP